MAEKLVHSFCGQAGCRFTGISILPGILWGPPVGKTFHIKLILIP